MLRDCAPSIEGPGLNGERKIWWRGDKGYKRMVEVNQGTGEKKKSDVQCREDRHACMHGIGHDQVSDARRAARISCREGEEPESGRPMREKLP